MLLLEENKSTLLEPSVCDSCLLRFKKKSLPICMSVTSCSLETFSSECTFESRPSTHPEFSNATTFHLLLSDTTVYIQTQENNEFVPSQINLNSSLLLSSIPTSLQRNYSICPTSLFVLIGHLLLLQKYMASSARAHAILVFLVMFSTGLSTAAYREVAAEARAVASARSRARAVIDGKAIDQGIGYLLMAVALVLTYVLH